MSKFKTLVSTVIFLLVTLPALPQCFPLDGDSPAFEFNIPSGVTITSVVVKIENFERRGNIRGRIRSFQDLGHAYFEVDGEYEVLASPISGPSTQDLQVWSGIDYTCGYLEDSVGFDWQVIITATGLSGTNLNYTGSLTDNLAIPTYIGKAYNGVNLVSGSIDLKQEGPGVAVYPDNDHDGFGDASAAPMLVCSEYCPFSTSTNNLDCNDFNPNINPEQQEIPDNGLDDDCDGRIDCVDNSFNYNSASFCHTDPNPIPTIASSGGSFSSSPGLILDANTGEIDLSASTPGTYVIAYMINESCTQESNFELGIYPTDNASFSYTQSIYCQNEVNPMPVITGNVGGVFTSITGLIFVNSTTGEVDLAASAPGTYTITYTTSGACSASSSFDITITSSPTVTSLTTSDISCDGFTISWDAVAGADEYIVEVSEQADFSVLAMNSTTSSITLTATELISGQTYYYRISNESNCGMISSSVASVTTIDVPAKPANLKASEIHENGFTVSWDADHQANTYWVELDDDPFFTSPEVSDMTTSSTYTFTSLLPETNYFVNVIGMNACGQGLYSTTSITTAVDPLISDSLALVALYHATDGDHWNRNDNWLTGPLKSWYGVGVSDSRVYSLDLSKNNLLGQLPQEINQLTKLWSFNFSNNGIYGIPDSLFYYSDSGGGLMHFNHLTFEDIINQPKIVAKLYAQNYVGKETTVYLKEGDSYTIDLNIDGSVHDNEYMWMKDSVVVATTHVNYLTLSDLEAADAGTYTCRITNPRKITELVLHSHPVTIHVSPLNEDPHISISGVPVRYFQGCTDDPITFSSNGRNVHDTYQWEIIRIYENVNMGLADSLRFLQSFDYTFQNRDAYKVRLTLSNPYDADTVLERSLNIILPPQLSVVASAKLSADSLMLTAMEAYDADSLRFEWYKAGSSENTMLGNKNTLWVKEGGTYRVTVTNRTGCQVYAETLVIDTRPQTQFITFDTIPDQIYGESFELQATASSGLPITYEVIEGQELISLSDHTVNILGVGTVRIQATQKGNHQYLAAEPVTQSFRIARAPQQIHFAEIPDRMLEEGGFTLEASSSVGLPLNLSFSGPIALVNQTLTLLDTGEVTITAAQQGNSYYLPAEPVSHSFHITQEMEKDTLHQLSIRIDAEFNHTFPLTLSLYQEQNGAYTLIAHESMLSAQLSFENLAEGKYTLKIKPDRAAFLPTYLGQQLLLSEAEKITLTQDTEVSLSPIRIPDILKETGITLRGIFMQSMQVTNGKLMITQKALEGIPVVGLTIYLIRTEDQSLQATTTTDGGGQFVFNNIPPGTYSIKADYRALPIDASAEFTVGDKPLDIIVMAGEAISLVSVEEEEDKVTAVEKEILQQLKFYPNPVEDELYLQLPVALVGGQLNIFDTHGRMVFTSMIPNAKVSCSLAHLSSGHYQIQISQQGKTYSLKILKK